MVADTLKQCESFHDLIIFYETNSILFEVEQFLADSDLFAQVITSRHDIVCFESICESNPEFYQILSTHCEKTNLLSTLNSGDEFISLLEKLINPEQWIAAYLSDNNFKRHITSFDELWNFFNSLVKINSDLEGYFLAKLSERDLKVIGRLMCKFDLIHEESKAKKNFYIGVYKYIANNKKLFSWTTEFIKKNIHNLPNPNIRNIVLETIEAQLIAQQLSKGDILFFAVKLDKNLLFKRIVKVLNTHEDCRLFYSFDEVAYLLRVCKEDPEILYPFLRDLEITRANDRIGLGKGLEQCLSIRPDLEGLRNIILRKLITHYGLVTKEENLNDLYEYLSPEVRGVLVEYQLTHARNFSDIMAIAPDFLPQKFEQILSIKNERFIKAYGQLKNYYVTLKTPNFDPKKLQDHPNDFIIIWNEGISESLLIKLAKFNQPFAIISHNMNMVPKLPYFDNVFLYQCYNDEPAILSEIRYSFLMTHAFPDLKTVVNYLDYHRFYPDVLDIILKPEQFSRLIVTIDCLYTLIAYYPEKKELIIETYLKSISSLKQNDEKIIKLTELSRYLPEAGYRVNPFIFNSKKSIKSHLSKQSLEENFDTCFKNNAQSNLFASIQQFFEIIERFPHHQNELMDIILSKTDILYKKIITSVAQLARWVSYFPNHNEEIFKSLTEFNKKRIATLITGQREILIIRKLFPHHALSLAWYIINDSVTSALTPNPELIYISSRPYRFVGAPTLPKESIKDRDSDELGYYHANLVDSFFEQGYYRAHQLDPSYRVPDRKFLSLTPTNISKIESRLQDLSKLEIFTPLIRNGKKDKSLKFPLVTIYERLLSNESKFKKEIIGLLTDTGISDRESTFLHYLLLFHVIYLKDTPQKLLGIIQNTILSGHDDKLNLNYFKYKKQCMDVISTRSIGYLLTSFIKEYQTLRSALFDWLFGYKDAQIFIEWEAQTPITDRDLQALYDCFYMQKSEINQILATILPVATCLKIGINLAVFMSEEISKKVIEYYQYQVEKTLKGDQPLFDNSCPVTLPSNLALFTRLYPEMDLKELLNDSPYIAFYPFTNFVNLFMREENIGFLDAEQMRQLHSAAESKLAKFIKYDYFTRKQFSSDLGYLSPKNCSSQNIKLHNSRIISLTIEILRVDLNWGKKAEHNDKLCEVLEANFGEVIAPIVALYKHKGSISEPHKAMLNSLRINITSIRQLEWLTSLEKTIAPSFENIGCNSHVFFTPSNSKTNVIIEPAPYEGEDKPKAK